MTGLRGEELAVRPNQIKVAQKMLDLVENAGWLHCELELTWAGHRVARAWRDGEGLHVEFPEGGV